MDEFIHYLKQIPFKFDCVVTTDSRRKRTVIMARLDETPVANCENCTVTVTKNVGRDVAPFFAACSDLIDQYDFIGHFHTKKSMTVNWGHEWRRYLLDQLLGSPETVSAMTVAPSFPESIIVPYSTSIKGISSPAFSPMVDESAGISMADSETVTF